MQLTLHSLTALRLIRAARSRGIPAGLHARCDLLAPITDGSASWTRATLRDALSWLGPMADFSPQRPLHVLCPSRETRIRTSGVKSSYCTVDLPAGAFVSLGHGVAIAGPELLFVEMARVMEPIVHLLLGMELCGGFSRDPLDPHDGPASYNVAPVTSIEKLRAFARQAHGLNGASGALETIDRIVENAWSPMEALIAALLVTPVNDLGYDLWPIVLNPRKEVSEYLAPYADKSSRVPDILFKGTHVGLNYDGADHFGLERIAQAAREAERNPGDARLAREAQEALRDARARIVADKRRDRELEAMGYVVPAVTKEDLLEPGGLDKVVAQVVGAIAREGSRDTAFAADAVSFPRLCEFRQLLIRSLMPGPGAQEARQRLSQVPKSRWPSVTHARVSFKKGVLVCEFI